MEPGSGSWLDALAGAMPLKVRMVVQGNSMRPTLVAGDEVLVVSVKPDKLRMGDWVVFRTPTQGYLHRYFGRHAGGMVTKGDGRRMFDSEWPAQNLIGRVDQAWRGQRCIYRRTTSRMRIEMLRSLSYYVVGKLAAMLHSLRVWAMLAVLLSVFTVDVQAAVTLLSFTASATQNTIVIRWETASEVGNLGFYLWRSEQETTGFVRLPLDTPDEQFIPSQDEGAGASYEYVDQQVTPGIRYYYRLQEVPATGLPGPFSNTISATIEGAAKSPTPTPTASPGPSPTATPVPTVLFWADPSTINAGDCSTIQWQASNVAAVYFNGWPTSGFGARTFCPCATQTYGLTVYYTDGRRDDFTTVIKVNGICDASTQSILATPTPPSGTPGISPTPTAQPIVVGPTPKLIPDTPLPTATPRLLVPTATPAVVGTPSVPQAPVDAGMEEDGSPDSLVVTRQFVFEAATSGSSSVRNILLVVGSVIIGTALVVGGVWFWRRRQ